MAKAALTSAVTQGVAVATGLQDRFDWRSVAASAVGAEVGREVGNSLSGNSFEAAFGSFGVRIAAGVGAGVAMSVMRGGRVDIVRVATDAFGNAIGQSVVENSSSLFIGSQQTGKAGSAVNPYVDPDTATHLVFGAPYASKVSDEALHQFAGVQTDGLNNHNLVRDFVPNSIDGVQLAVNGSAVNLFLSMGENKTSTGVSTSNSLNQFSRDDLVRFEKSGCQKGDFDVGSLSGSDAIQAFRDSERQYIIDNALT